MTFVPLYDRAAVSERVCDELAKGRTLRAVCRDAGMPDPSTIIKWMIADVDGFAGRYRRAREIGYHLMADELLEIADDSSNDHVVREGGNVLVPDRVNVARSRLRLETRRWLLSKALPKLYGDRLDLAAVHHVGDGLRELMKAVDGKTRGLPSRD